jgi:hypothetical protein
VGPAQSWKLPHGAACGAPRGPDGLAHVVRGMTTRADSFGSATGRHLSNVGPWGRGLLPPLYKAAKLRGRARATKKDRQGLVEHEYGRCVALKLMPLAA